MKEDSSSETKKFSWPPLESNPEVFTTYLHSIGLSPTFSIGEVYGFDEELLAFLPQPILGIIVCYERLLPKSEIREEDKGSKENYDQVSFYMHQSKVLDNACGIIACLHAVFNTPLACADIDSTSVLGKFIERARNLTPMERCTALENDTDFQKIHRNYASQGQSKEIAYDQSAVKHHFVAYVLNNEKKLVELDGTKAGPVILGECGDVLRGSIQEIKGKLERGEISESLSMMTLSISHE